jgi:hypothetical protein
MIQNKNGLDGVDAGADRQDGVDAGADRQVDRHYALPADELNAVYAAAITLRGYLISTQAPEAEIAGLRFTIHNLPMLKMLLEQWDRDHPPEMLEGEIVYQYLHRTGRRRLLGEDGLSQTVEHTMENKREV